MDAFEFVNRLDSNQHLFQIITDDAKAKNTQFQFINNGLLKNEYCIYLTHEDPDAIKDEMKKSGMDVRKFSKDGLLHIYKVPDLLSHPNGSLAGFQEFFSKIMPDPKTRFRVIGRAIEDLTTEKGRNAELEIEQFVHSNFEKMNGMILCYYEYEKLGDRGAMSFITHVLSYHSGAIFSTVSEPNFAYAVNH